MGHRHTKRPQQIQYKNKCMKPQSSSNCRLYSGRLMQARNMGSTPNKLSHTLSHLGSITMQGHNYLPHCSISMSNIYCNPQHVVFYIAFSYLGQLVPTTTCVLIKFTWKKAQIVHMCAKSMEEGTNTVMPEHKHMLTHTHTFRLRTHLPCKRPRVGLCQLA